MKTVTLYWRYYGITKKRKREVVKLIRQYYDWVKWTNDYVKIKVVDRDSKYIWICMQSKAFLLAEKIYVRFDP